MRTLLLSALFLPNIVFSQLEILEEKPRFVTVTHKECEVREVYVENKLGGSIVGGIIGGLIGKQVGNGSGKDIATIAGTIAGANIGRTRTENNGELQYKEICRDVEKRVQKGKYAMISINQM